ncbi:hypothetical protein J3A83DRAFT_4163569 [Scleroderma citrinum]
MVGILSWGNRNSPSLDLSCPAASDTPLSSRDPRSLSSEAPVSRDVFSPAHVGKPAGGHSNFFSLPNWTRRILPASSRKNLTSLNVDEHGAIASSPPRTKLPPNKDKDLPPDPPRDSGPRACSNDTGSRSTLAPLRSVSAMNPCHQGHKAPRRPSTATMAVRLDSPSKRCDTNPDVHRDSIDSRSRVISLAAIPAKVQGTTLLGVERDHPQSSLLTRKPSFWSRKISNPVPHPAPSGSLSLPVVQPTSPFKVDFEPESDISPQHRSGPSSLRLKRRHSERASRRPSANIGDLPALPSPNPAHRPSTAGAFPPPPRIMRRPNTADSSTRHRAKSFFPLSSRAANTSKVPVATIDPDKPVARPGKSVPSNGRHRSATNPPLLHRLSVNLFSYSPTSGTKSGGFFTNGSPSPVTKSPRPSSSQIPAEHLKPLAEESPVAFVQRLISHVSKADIAGILASSVQGVYPDSLKLYLNRFAFSGDPLDVALRRLLMDVSLPRETQQIDRVIEAFASRYMLCNPDLFSSSGTSLFAHHTYILAFSLIMLHTDAFNKSNRRKMTKADYVKNTSLPGLIPEVLDCFYDNIVFAPFVFIEDPMDSGGGVNANSEGLTRPSTPVAHSSPLTTTGNTLLSKPKIDPYYLIMNNLLDQLRVNVEEYIPMENPFRWDGTGASWDYDEILLAFSESLVIAISSVENARLPAAFFGLTVGGFPSSSGGGGGGIPDIYPVPPELRHLRLIKVAMLNRKDDVLEGGKKLVNRKWRPWSVALTQSQILLFRDLTWTTTLLSWNDTPKPPPVQSTQFRPDEIIPIKDALAVFDRSYTRHSYTFCLATSDGRRILFQAINEREMNEWISRINYASAFKSAGIRIRPLGMTGEDVELTGIAAAVSHLQNLRSPHQGQPRILSWGHPDSENTFHRGMDSDGEVLFNCQGLQSDSPAAPEVEGASQFKETFDAVKAGLAAAHIATGQDGSLVQSGDSENPNYSVDDVESSNLSSRTQIIHSRVRDLEAQICATNSEIDSSLRFVRNVAVLAPFQKSTRDRLQEAIQGMSKRIQALRLDITKLICHRNILLKDLAAETRVFKRAASLALQTATEALHNCALESVSIQATGDTRAVASTLEHNYGSTSRSFDSSSGPSFRTALDLGPDWPSSGEAFATSTFRESSRITESPVLEAQGASPSHLFPDEHSHLSELTPNHTGPDTSFEKVSVASESPEEQAEEWNKTKAAKRVSLVRLPSDLRLSVLLGKSSRHPYLAEISPGTPVELIERSLPLS